MSLEDEMPCTYRRPGVGQKKNCGCGDRNYELAVYRCSYPDHKDFCTLSRYDRYQQERICQFCPKRHPGPLTDDSASQ